MATMKRITLAVAILAIFCLMAFMNLLIVNAYGPRGDGLYPVLYNCLPTGVGTYTNTNIDISMNYYLPKDSIQIDSFSCSLDGDSNSTLSYTSKDGTEAIVSSMAIQDFSKYIYYYIFGPLEDLANGNHSLLVYAYFLNGTASQIWDSTFRVNTDFVPPKLIVISPQNQSTYSNAVPIVFNTNSKVIMSYYALSSSSSNGWIPFSGNTTLTGLSEGQHTLTIFVVTEANTQSAQANCEQTIDFNVRSNQNNQLLQLNNQTNMVFIAVLVVTIIVIAAALLLFKRNKAKDAND